MYTMKNKERIIFKGIRNGLSLFLVAGIVACSGQTTEETVDDDLIAGADVTEDVGLGVDTWDTNKFNTTFGTTNYYEDWDLNDDNIWDENEFYGGFYDTWDVNDDNQINENEWNTATNSYGIENETWSIWDTSGDGILDENEFRTGFGRTNYYADWDMDNDNMLNEREYTDGIFGLWDENEDGILDENEYADYNTYYGI